MLCLGCPALTNPDISLGRGRLSTAARWLRRYPSAAKNGIEGLRSSKLSVDATRPTLTAASAYLNCAGVTTAGRWPAELTFFMTLRSTERIARPRNQRLLLCF